jgi:hypothetical protein
VFGAVAKANTEIAVRIRRSLETVGRTADTELRAFTDGCSGLQSILAEAGCKKPPIVDWFHIAMRLQHAKQAASGLVTDTPGRMHAKAVFVAEVERLHWRIWNCKAKNARRTLERVRKVMHVFQGDGVHRTTAVPSSRKPWRALRRASKYLRGQSASLVNYAKRYRPSLRVGTSVTEGTANFLVNRRMNKQQQMRWSRPGADLLLQVRCAVVVPHALSPRPSATSTPCMASVHRAQVSVLCITQSGVRRRHWAVYESAIGRSAQSILRRFGVEWRFRTDDQTLRRRPKCTADNGFHRSTLMNKRKSAAVIL